MNEKDEMDEELKRLDEEIKNLKHKKGHLLLVFICLLKK